jgi:hypothetical protein
LRLDFLAEREIRVAPFGVLFLMPGALSQLANKGVSMVFSKRLYGHALFQVSEHRRDATR